ncbi:uncharacterized protein MEPE_05772 [Melanopsichium pennsylvanicum]|uniref:J domain-containing protein n=2 Tax=Melanopsichium pennsylvanicum TaxID=63383 RepID=A0AAJ5C7M1_9BASI|nr:domain protein [Melanopsichium pennsylvanicum 4]SNX87062.1 uncharacterized protein MEPE_05772 [Melanopsichium pennsylvanicum]
MTRFPEVDPYTVLNVPRGCSHSDIKAAYKKAALSSHPDRAPFAEKEAATARFKVVGEAYEFLSDPRKRRDYDNFGPGGDGGLGAGSFGGSSNPEYEDDESRKHFGTSPDGVPFSFMWESSADSARRAQAGRRAGRPFGADGLDPFELFNMMFSKEFGSSAMGGGGNVREGGHDPFGMMGGGTGNSLFGDNDPFLQNHRRMADSMGFAFGAPPQPMRSGPPMGMASMQSQMFSGAPFATSGFSSSSNSSSTTYGGFGGISESTTTRIVNGRKETVTRRMDERGNETVHTQTPEGNSVFVNGVQQATHPLLGNVTSTSSNALPSTRDGRNADMGASAENPIVVDSGSEPQTPSSTAGFGMRF